MGTKLTNRQKFWVLTALTIFVTVPLWSYGGQVGPLVTFENGQVADADEVNGNFGQIVAAVNDNNTRLAVAETQLSTQAVALAAIRTSLDGYVSSDGDTMSGALAITGLPASTRRDDALISVQLSEEPMSRPTMLSIRDETGFSLFFVDSDGNGAFNNDVAVGGIFSAGRYNPITAAGAVQPEGNGLHNLGQRFNRWANIYSATPVDVSSDARLKRDIDDLAYGLDAIRKLRPVSYELKNPKTPGKRIGFLGQDVQRVIPELVSGDAKESYLSMSYTELIPVQTKAIQELAAQNDALKKRLADIEAKLASCR